MILDMCEDYNRKGVLDVISEIKDCSKETEAVINKINEYVRRSDFDEAENTVDLYLAELALEGVIPETTQPKTNLSNIIIGGLDIAKGLKRYDGDEETYIKILRSYAGSVSSLIPLIKTVNANILDGYRIRVHGIKGASYDIYADAIGKRAEALEHAAAAGNLTFINEHNLAFINDIDTFLTEITNVLTAISAENPKPQKDKPEPALLKDLRAACRGYSMKNAETALSEMEKYQYDSDDGLADWLRKAINNMELTMVVEKLAYLEADENGRE
jgi:HPt (histidine-containing phosphotransfer) domain-containing protein